MEEWKTTRRHCQNCGEIVTGSRNEKGIVKLLCPRCGLCMINKRVSRRREQVDVIVPSGKYIDN